MSRRAKPKRGPSAQQPSTPTPALPASDAPPVRRASSFTLSWLFSTYIILLSAGFAALRTPLTNVNGNEFSIDRAIFTVINAVTLTGFEQAIGVNELRPAGQVAVFLLMTAGTWISLVVGGVLVTRIVRLPFTDKQIVTSSLFAIGIAGLLGMIGLGHDCGGVWPGLFAGISALGNSGMVLNRIGSAATLTTQIVLLPLCIAGGLSVPVLLEILHVFRSGRSLSQHSVSVLSTSAVIYIVGLGLILALQFIGTAGDDAGRCIAVCSAVVINSRSGGFPLTPVATFTRAAQWIIMSLMMLGSAPGGTAGGIKATTPLLLWRGVRRIYYAEPPGRAVAVAFTWVTAYLGLIVAGLLTLLMLQPEVPVDRLLFMTISAASNVGLSHDPISIVGPGLYVLGIVAVLGRFMPWLVLFWMARAVSGADVAVG